MQVDEFPQPDYEAMVVGPKGPCTVRYTRKTAADHAEDAAKPVHATAHNTSSVGAKTASGASESTAPSFTAAEVLEHNTREDAWIIVDQKVYDISPYVEGHPGGDAILQNVGGDSSIGFNGPQHPPTVRDALDSFYIGDLTPPPSTHKGFGKLILFGEHFVVYKAPALITAVSASTTCAVERTTKFTGFRIVDQRPAVPGYKSQKADEAQQSVQLVLDHLNVDTKTQGLIINFGGDLCCVSGIGASAAACVSLARALDSLLHLNLSESQINAAAYEGEKGYHGTPSGVDNTSSTYGGLLRFTRTDKDPLFETKKLNHKCGIVFASTGITASTTKVVGDVASKREGDMQWFESLLDEYKVLVPKAEDALEKGDYATVGELLDQNHELYQRLTVSCDELDQLVSTARAAGALGAKMSGECACRLVTVWF